MQENEAQTCPRRMAEFGPWKREESLDRWCASGGLVDQREAGLSCSFCGSLDPVRFLELVREGWIVGPTDKSYKVYLARPYSTQELERSKERWLATDAVARAVRDLGERDGKSAEQVAADLDGLWDQHAEITADGKTVAKFYLLHLDEAQRDDFLALHNGGTMRIGYPGHLYVAPFFARRAATDPPAASGE